jgi:hypothetical protein
MIRETMFRLIQIERIKNAFPCWTVFPRGEREWNK